MGSPSKFSSLVVPCHGATPSLWLFEQQQPHEAGTLYKTRQSCPWGNGVNAASALQSVDVCSPASRHRNCMHNNQAGQMVEAAINQWII